VEMGKGRERREERWWRVAKEREARAEVAGE
jgi:hypothetical protein